MASASTTAKSPRIASLDQFRGYTVAGMMLVNFIGGFLAVHSFFTETGWGGLQYVFEHKNNFHSYADSIMPSFHFAVGFALRLTLLRRLQTVSRGTAYFHVLRRCLGLILLSTVLELAGSHPRFASWEEFVAFNWREWIADFMKCGFWETLAIIGVTSIWVLPVISRGVSVRVLFALMCIGLHVVLSYLFYFDFLWGRDNWLDPWWGAAGKRGLDGGPFGFLMWGVVQIVGSLAYDAMANSGKGSAAGKILSWSIVLMLLGYALSCLTTLYNVDSGNSVAAKAAIADAPVWPTNLEFKAEDWRSQLAEPPFVRPPPAPLDQEAKDAPVLRQKNYWMMCKLATTPSYILFSSGFALAVYGLLVILNDIARLQVGFFRTFGQNALAAYVLHAIVEDAVRPFVPRDAPWYWVWAGFALFFAITYLFVRHLEKQGIFIRM